LELLAADAYRRLFVDLDSLAESVAEMGPYSSLIEVGCGEGSLLTRLVARLGRDVTALGIDIAADPGRSFVGDRARVTFCQATVAEIAGAGNRFDLVVVSEVLYYWPKDVMLAALRRFEEILAPGGALLAVHWRKETKTYPLQGDEVHELLLRYTRLANTATITESEYRLDLFEDKP